MTSYVAFSPQLEQTFSGSGKNATESCNTASLHALNYLAGRGKSMMSVQNSNNQTLELTVQNLAKSNEAAEAKEPALNQVSPSVSLTNSISSACSTSSTSSSSSNSSTSTIILNQKFLESKKTTNTPDSSETTNDEAKN